MIQDRAIIGLIEAVLNDFVENQSAFTAFDVTTTVRSRIGVDRSGSPLANVPHEDVREIVYETMAGAIEDEDESVAGYRFEKRVIDPLLNLTDTVYFHESRPEYSRKSSAVGAGPVRRVYHMPDLSLVSAGKIQMAVETGTASKLFLPMGVRKTDKHLRLRWPARVLREAGFAPADQVDLVYRKDDQELSVTAGGTKHDDSVIVIGTRKVDRYGILRTGLKSALGITQVTAFAFAAQANIAAAKKTEEI